MTDQGHKLGEVLRAAREGKGVDLRRVERDTKIRERYLLALESGDYRDLPGSVYTRGFLRNYGTYLGLDPEYLIDLYRLETSTTVERPRVPAPPRPIAAARSRSFVITPGLVVAALLTVGVGAFVAYLGWELINFARTPELRITDPATNVSAYTELTMVVRGITAPNARVTVGNLRENPSVEADDEGRFEVTVELVPGSNVIELVARDPVTSRDSEPEQRTVVVVGEVAASEPPPGLLSLEAPAPEASGPSPVSIAGTSSTAPVEVSATLVSPAAATFSITGAGGQAVPAPESPPAAPTPLTLEPDATGAFAGELALPPGTWQITVGAPDVEAVTREVVVAPPDGISGTLRVGDAASYLEVEQDGAPLSDLSGAIAPGGTEVAVAAAEELRVLAGNAAAVELTINGIPIGAMGGDGEVVEWRITPSGG